MKPACIAAKSLFEAVRGATAAREELLDLLSYCVLILSIVLDNALVSDLPAHVKMALQQLTEKIVSNIEAIDIESLVTDDVVDTTLAPLQIIQDKLEEMMKPVAFVLPDVQSDATPQEFTAWANSVSGDELVAAVEDVLEYELIW